MQRFWNNRYICNLQDWAWLIAWSQDFFPLQNRSWHHRPGYIHGQYIPTIVPWI